MKLKKIKKIFPLLIRKTRFSYIYNLHLKMCLQLFLELVSYLYRILIRLICRLFFLYVINLYRIFLKRIMMSFIFAPMRIMHKSAFGLSSSSASATKHCVVCHFLKIYKFSLLYLHFIFLISLLLH